MSLTKEQKAALHKKLELVREREMDCDEFSEHLAQYVEAGPMSEDVRALMRHHMEVCPECAEELATLKKALG